MIKVYDQLINPRWLLSRFEDDDDTDKQLHQQAEKVLLAKRWSHSRFADTESIKVSKASSARIIEESPFDSGESAQNAGHCSNLHSR
ncbi:hypothetical protein [Pelagibaculum spongiae]|uniref:Uncharacterized protein n=1 Tax=Pelagibaculum spongiae TaxID=2080658 RepID=A0A2V1H4B7_9GAMM|nr:hypothetical protein [Pelagibaculum spongiae]PVZ72068.1 hypothetical protein DC094_03340 [Pelagibaculum spongiae]